MGHVEKRLARNRFGTFHDADVPAQVGEFGDGLLVEGSARVWSISSRARTVSPLVMTANSSTWCRSVISRRWWRGPGPLRRPVPRG